jgi:hypothetical protein
MTLSGIELATFRLVAQCLDQLRYNTEIKFKVTFFLRVNLTAGNKVTGTKTRVLCVIIAAAVVTTTNI